MAAEEQPFSKLKRIKGTLPSLDDYLGGMQLFSCKMGTGSFPGVKCGRSVLLTTHPLLVPLS